MYIYYWCAFLVCSHEAVAHLCLPVPLDLLIIATGIHARTRTREHTCVYVCECMVHTYSCRALVWEYRGRELWIFTQMAFSGIDISK